MNTRSRRRYWLVVASGAMAGVVAFTVSRTPDDRSSAEDHRGGPVASKAARSNYEANVTIMSAREHGAVATVKTRFAEKGPEEIWFLPELQEVSRVLNAPGTTAAQDLSTLESLLSVYRRANGGNNPIAGSNEQLVQQLQGRNPKRFAVLPPDFSGISPNGELLDRWGSPYFFHPLSHEQMEIRSAGPDRVFWTADDVSPSWMAAMF